MPKLVRITLLVLTSLTNAIAIAQVAPEPVAARFVVHDIGGWWHNVLVQRADGTVAAVGNPWLGATRQNPLALEGVADITRLAALGAGRTEVVAAVGATGLTMIRWNSTSHTYDLVPWAQPQLAGARAVRAASFVTQHMVTVLCADDATLRSFRFHGAGSGFEVAAFTVASPVLDYEPFRTADGVGRVFVATAEGLQCRGIQGASSWSLAGTSGDLLAWTGDAAVRAAWLHRDLEGRWRVALLGDEGPVRVDALDAAIDETETVVAGFGIDANGDEATDLVVKTHTATRVFLQPVGGVFQDASLVASSGTGVPDVIATHGGAHAWLVEGPSAATVQWTRIWGASLLVPVEDMDLRGTASLDTSVTNASKVDFSVEIAPEWLQPFVRPDRQTWLQIVAWRQQFPGDLGRLDAVSESNVMFPLVAPPNQPTEPTRWPLSVTMLPEVDLESLPPGWSGDDHYWLTIRVVRTAGPGSLAPDRVSDPITFATSLSVPQRLGETPWQFLLSLCEPGTEAGRLPLVRISPPGSGQQAVAGGIVVGVITRIRLPPPPPPAGVPSPRDASEGPPSAQQNP